MKIRLMYLFLFLTDVVAGQDSAKVKNNSLIFTGYIDFYYQYDFNKPTDKSRPPFLYNFKRTNGLDINLTLLKASYSRKRIRSNLGIMAGNYSQYNLAAEPNLLKNIYEANVGFVFSKKVSVDAGIIPSHIGLETAIAKDHWNLSRSILADNSPYYETGIKFNYIPNEKWLFSFLVLNGWQNIQETNSNKAIGSQVQFKPNEKILINSSTFFGNEKPDSSKQLRLFHNFYTTYNITSKFSVAFLFDAGIEQKRFSNGFNNWIGSAILMQFRFSKKWNAASRCEWYQDKNGVIVTGYLPNGFQATGYSINLDYKPVSFLVFRTEGRLFHSSDKIFVHDGQNTNNNFSLLISGAAFF